MARQALVRLPVIHLTSSRRAASGAVALLATMALGSAALWAGVPLGGLWVAAIVQDATGSLAAGLLVALAGAGLSIPAAVGALTRLSDRHRRLVVARGAPDPGTAPLEAVMVGCAALAVAVAVGLIALHGAAPLPVPG